LSEQPAMQENLLFEYAIIRIVPLVEREEFMNVGVILYCPSRKFLECRISLNVERANGFFRKGIDCQEINKYLNAFEKICNGSRQGGVIATLPQVSRFRWLTATRSTILQASKVHPGLCVHPEVTLDQLFHELVV